MKPLLFIPFLALLGTSCGGGHITTTPVLNGPNTAFLNAPKREAHQDTIIRNQVNSLDLGELYWWKQVDYYFSSGVDDLVTLPSNTACPNIICYKYTTANYATISAQSADRVIGLYGTQNRFCIRDTTYTDASNLKDALKGIKVYYLANGGTSAWETAYNEGIADGYNLESNKLTPNGMYTGLTIFPKRAYLEETAFKVWKGQYTPENGQFYLIDTNGNYTIDIKWTFNETYNKTTFQDGGNEIIGELYWLDVKDKNWSTSWFYLYDKELHNFARPKTYATDAPIDTSFYPEVYLGSTFTGGDANLYFAGGGNAYQMGFVDGQTYTIHASETYQNVFTIFTPAFRAVADFFNLNIGPFKVWYFFAIPLIVTLLILVLRLVKH